MNGFLEDYLELAPILAMQSGVVLASDLGAFWQGRSHQTRQNRISAFTSCGILRKVRRGVYVAKEFDPWALACRMYPGAVITTVSVLARRALVGTVAREQVWCAHPGRGCEHGTNGIAVHAWSLDPTLLGFGIESDGAIRVATAEKAFLDTLHYHLHGRIFPFSVPDDIDVSRLDVQILETYLDRYRNSRFRAFAKGIIHAGS